MKYLLFLIVLLPSVVFSQHTIKGVFSPAKDYNVALLYKVTPTLSEYIANAKVKEDGSFEFQLDSTASKGIYRIVYAAPQEDYNFDVIYNTKEDIELTFNSETGVKFKKSVENKLLASYTSSMSMVTQSISNYFKQNSSDTTALNTIFKTQRDTQLKFEKAAKETIALKFIKANKPYTPKAFIGVEDYVDNLKTHYFDYVDFKNSALQSSSFLQEKMLNYVFGISANSKDEIANYKKNIDVFYNAAKNAPNKVKRILLVDLWEQMSDLNIEPVANYISETYLMDLAVTLNDQSLLRALIKYKDLSIGSVAPDFFIELKEGNKKLRELKEAENYIIVFWSSTCSHCLGEIPHLQDFIKSQKKGTIKVIAVGLEDEPYKWKDLTYSYPEFIHVYGKGKWENEIGNSYNVTATPTYFILNKNKEIAAKPEDFEAVKAFFKTKD
ncbi:redoxin [Flavivirga aquatica]|uniref:Redoxin n=1 Tax=Flavivirga aquatica TaxID=1849968 RepID=A0A1E5TER4_9FLAO|nr:TlpA disulfide reductase family protein [Flavivirga aquatica]OEK09866.1 redoxin [Flavivirga aquatica]